MKISIGDLRSLVREAVAATATKDNPITAWPKVGPSGELMWIIKDGLQTAVINTTTGEIHGSFAADGSEAFKVIVGALGEWYKVDREEYAGENITKVKGEAT